MQKELQHAKRRASLLPSDGIIQSIQPGTGSAAANSSKAAIPTSADAEKVKAVPPPPAVAPPPPPPPPPPKLGLPKPPTKTWKVAAASSSDSSNNAGPKTAVKSKSGFEVSLDQLTSMAGRLRKTTQEQHTSAPKAVKKQGFEMSMDQLTSVKLRKATAPPKEAKQPSPNNLGATLRARMTSRRSSLLQDENKDNTSPTQKTGLQGLLKRAPIRRSPGGTPYKDPSAATTKHAIPFNTSLADKNLASPPREPGSAQFDS